jgi:hypothetical protein
MVLLVAPCQCVSPAGMCTTSPTNSFLGVSPLEQTNPVPIVTVKIWPRSCVCQNVRAPGVKQTLFPMQSSAVKIGSMCTVPVKVSVGCLEAVLGLWAARINCIVRYVSVVWGGVEDDCGYWVKTTAKDLCEACPWRRYRSGVIIASVKSACVCIYAPMHCQSTRQSIRWTFASSWVCV